MSLSAHELLGEALIQNAAAEILYAQARALWSECLKTRDDFHEEQNRFAQSCARVTAHARKTAGLDPYHLPRPPLTIEGVAFECPSSVMIVCSACNYSNMFRRQKLQLVAFTCRKCFAAVVIKAS
jgi:hypothetical protein